VTLNLARRPFANLRPLRRLAIGLWALGGVAAAAALWLFAAYLSGSAEKRAELGRLQEVGAAESQKIAGLEGELGRFDLAAQNREVAYINDRISERTFGWLLVASILLFAAWGIVYSWHHSRTHVATR